LEEDFLQAQGNRPQLVQIPAGFHDGPRELGSHGTPLQTLHFKKQFVIAILTVKNAAYAGHLLKPPLRLLNV
jgi:hypothetical protein